MKKSTKYLLLSGMAIISGACAFAQNPKQCDLKVTLTTPAANAVFNYNDQVSIKFDITNMGPAAIVPTDTIFYTLPTGNILFATGNNIANMASKTIDLGAPLSNINETGNDETFDFCIKLLKQSDVFYTPQNGGDTVWVATTYDDTVANNDEDCNSITFKSKVIPPPVGIYDVKTEKGVLNLYPNPATDKVMFNIALQNPETAIAVIRDVTGREVMQKDFGKVQPGTSSPLELNIAQLNAGIYMVEITAGDKKFIGKVTKQN